VAIFARWRSLARLPAARGRDPFPGVYEIADGDKRVIYVGQSARDVPGRLREHLSGGGCVAERGVYWRAEGSRIPRAREAELLALHRARHGELPSCNQVAPLQRDARRRYVERSQ
jgi:hypothetical protein